MMRTMNVLWTIILLLSFPLIISCVTSSAIQAESTDEVPSIYEKYSFRFEKIEIGMSEEEVLEMFPEALLVGKQMDMSAYEFTDTQVYYTQHDKTIGVWWTGSIKTHEYKQVVWFYFVDNALVKYGTPNDWPKFEIDE